MRRIARHAAALLAFAFAVAAVPATSRTLEEVRKHGELRVGVALFAPWAARDADGKLLGFEIDVANQVAADLGVKATIRTYAVERLIPALEAGEIDLIAAGLTITPDRARHVNFSNPYAFGGVVLAAHRAKTAGVDSLADLDSDGFTVAVVQGSVAAELLRRALPRAAARTFPSVETASRALLDGEVHALLEDEPVPTFLALEEPDIVDLPLATPLLESPAGFAVGKGDPDFLAYLNAWIVAREADTWLPARHSYWFKSLRWRRSLGDAP